MKVTIVDGDLPLTFLEKCLECQFLGLDTETSGVNRKKDQLACLQVYAEHPEEPECVIVRRLSTRPNNIILLMNKIPAIKIFHHAPFDLEFLMRDFPDIKPKKVMCTKLMAKMVDPNKTRFYDPINERAGHSLAALVYTFCGVKLDKSHAVSNWFAAELSHAQVTYAVNDIQYLPIIYRELVKILADSQKLQSYYDAVKALPVMLDYELQHGITNLYGYS